MPRRPLFCPTCTELLDQLEKAADAVCHGESSLRQMREQSLDRGLEPAVDWRIRYLKIKERAQEHLERHVHSGNLRSPVSAEDANSKGAILPSVATDRAARRESPHAEP